MQHLQETIIDHGKTSMQHLQDQFQNVLYCKQSTIHQPINIIQPYRLKCVLSHLGKQKRIIYSY